MKLIFLTDFKVYLILWFFAFCDLNISKSLLLRLVLIKSSRMGDSLEKKISL